MQIPELLPLLEMVKPLESHPQAQEVYAFVTDAVQRANTPSMAQSACEKIIVMCHPKAWGDMYIQDFGGSWAGWLNFLDHLKQTAESCGHKIYKIYK